MASGMLQSLPCASSMMRRLGVIIWDSTFCVAEWNKAAERIFGWPRDEAQSQHASFIIPIPVRPLVDDIFRTLLHAGDAQH